MSAISRRSFLKLAGVTAAATAGASMLTGCSLFEMVEVTVILDGEQYGDTQEVPWVVAKLAQTNINEALSIIAQNLVDGDYKGINIIKNPENPDSCKIVRNAEGKYVMVVDITYEKVTLSYDMTITYNGQKTQVTGTYDKFPKGLKVIPETVLFKLVEEKYPQYKGHEFVLDSVDGNGVVSDDYKTTLFVTVR